MKPRRGHSGWKRIGGVDVVTDRNAPAGIRLHKTAFLCDKPLAETVILEHEDGRRKGRFVHADGTFHDTDLGVLETLSKQA